MTDIHAQVDAAFQLLRRAELQNPQWTGGSKSALARDGETYQLISVRPNGSAWAGKPLRPEAVLRMINARMTCAVGD
jgi:hypothetical protein